MGGKRKVEDTEIVSEDVTMSVEAEDAKPRKTRKVRHCFTKLNLHI